MLPICYAYINTEVTDFLHLLHIYNGTLPKKGDLVANASSSSSFRDPTMRSTV